MDEARPPGLGEDAAWVGVDTTLPAQQLLALLDDPERLLRVNSQWLFEHWESTAPKHFQLRIRNQSNGRVWETGARLVRLPDGLRLDYDQGIKGYTRLTVEPVPGGSRLWVVEDYGRLPEAERRERTVEVDRSLPQWGRDLYVYLRAWRRWSRIAPWRWYMERVWRPMRPLGRRIVRLLVWATVAELLLFLGLILALRLDLGA